MTIDKQIDPYELFSICITAEESDIDGLNHVNNGVYVNWCERAAWAHSDALGVNLDAFKELDRAMVIRHAEYDYKLASYLGDVIRIETWLASQTATGMERHFRLVRAHDDQVVMNGIWQLVCLEISSGRPKRLPDLFMKAYL